MEALIKPEDFHPDDPNNPGKKLHYILSNFDAIEGRRIIALYPITGLPKVGDYEQNEKTMFKLMEYVAVPRAAGEPLRLTTPALIKNHVPDSETLLKIELAMMEKNYSFFRDGRGLDFFERLLQILLKKASEMLTPLSERSSPTAAPPSTNSELSTT